jgi:hypothetical protein
MCRPRRAGRAECWLESWRKARSEVERGAAMMSGIYVYVKCGGGGDRWVVVVVIVVVVVDGRGKWERGGERGSIEMNRKGRKDNRGIYRMGVPREYRKYREYSVLRSTLEWLGKAMRSTLGGLAYDQVEQS